MKTFIVLLSIALSGCGVVVDTSSKQIEWAEKVCANNGGVKSIKFFSHLTPNAACNNGAYFRATVSDLEAVEGHGE